MRKETATSTITKYLKMHFQKTLLFGEIKTRVFAFSCFTVISVNSPKTYLKHTYKFRLSLSKLLFQLW